MGTSNHTYLSDDDGNRINPATVENQETLVTEALKSTAINSANWGTEKITLDGDGLGTVSVPVACRECYISHQISSNDLHLAIKNSGDADANDFLLPPNVVIPLPIRNTSQIRLFGTATDLVYIMWRD